MLSRDDLPPTPEWSPQPHTHALNDVIKALGFNRAELEAELEAEAQALRRTNVKLCDQRPDGRGEQ